MSTVYFNIPGNCFTGSNRPVQINQFLGKARQSLNRSVFVILNICTTSSYRIFFCPVGGNCFFEAFYCCFLDIFYHEFLESTYNNNNGA